MCIISIIRVRTYCHITLLIRSDVHLPRKSCTLPNVRFAYWTWQWNNQINQIRPDKNALDYLIRSGWQRPIFVRKLPIFDLIWSGCICFFPAGGDIWSVSVFVYLLIHRTFFWRWPIFYLFLMRRWRQWTKNDASSHPGLMLLAYKY